MPAADDKNCPSSQTQEAATSQTPTASDPNGLCGTCNKPECTVQVGNRTSQKWISCDQCSTWFHGMCQGLQAADVNLVIKLEKLGVRWYCDQCRSIIKNTIPKNSLPREENSSTLTKLNDLEQMMKKFTQTYADAAKTNAERILKLEKSCETTLKETSQNIQKAVQINQSAEKMMVQNNQRNEIETRKNNAILYGIEEKENTTAIQEVQELMRFKLYLHCQMPLQAIRLGKKIENKIRPIKLVFADEPSKWEFIKRTNAKNTRVTGVFCKLDTSKEMRDKEFQLRDQIRRLKEDDANANIQYRIRTRETKVEIEERLQSGEWRPLNPALNQTKETTC